MKESLIFAELLQILSREEKNKLDLLINTQNLSDLQLLIVEYIKKYRSALINL